MNKVLIIIGILAVGCEANIAQYTSLGSDGNIKCFSGGVVIYDGKSIGKIQTEERSDGWFFVDSQTHKLIRVSGDCVIQN